MRASRTGQRCTRSKLCHHTTSPVFFDCLNLATPQVWVIERHELVRVESAVDNSGFGAGLIATPSLGRTLTVLAPYHTRSTEPYQQPKPIPRSIESSPRHVHLLTHLMRPNASPETVVTRSLPQSVSRMPQRGLMCKGSQQWAMKKTKETLFKEMAINWLKNQLG